MEETVQWENLDHSGGGMYCPATAHFPKPFAGQGPSRTSGQCTMGCAGAQKDATVSPPPHIKPSHAQCPRHSPISKRRWGWRSCSIRTTLSVWIRASCHRKQGEAKCQST